MGTKTSLIISYLFILFFGIACNNPSGNTVIGVGHGPLLKLPSSFDFTSIRASNGNIELNWSSANRAESYTVLYGSSEANISTPAPSCSGLNTSCVISGLDPNIVYYIKAIAKNGAGETPANNTGVALSTSTFDFSASSSGDRSINLSWDPSDNATSYEVHYGTAPGVYTHRVTGVSSPFVLPNLLNETFYFVRVIAVNAQNGYTQSTSEVMEKPFGPLTAPQNLSIAVTTSSIDLNWDDLNGASSYKVYRGLTPGSLVEIANSVPASQFSDTSGTPGTTYYYAVRAWNSFDSDISSTVSGARIASFNMLSATPSATPSEVILTWQNPVAGAESFVVYYGTTPGSLNLTLLNATSPQTISGLTGNVTYYFQIRALNSVGPGAARDSTNVLNAIPISGVYPEVKILSAPVIWSGNASAYPLSGTCSENGEAVTLSVGGIAGVATCTSGNWSQSLNVSSLADQASVTITATHINSSGNSTTDTLTVQKDTTAPSIAISAPSSGSFVNQTSNTTTLSVSGSCSESGRIVSITVNSSPAPLASGFSCNGATFSGTIDVTGFSEGILSFRALISDAVGNSTTSAAVNVTKDITPPSITLNSVSPITPGNQSSVSVSGTCGDITGNLSVTLGSLSSNVSCGGGIFSSTFNASPLPEGSITVSAQGSDLAGNIRSQSGTVIKDTTAPVLTISYSPTITSGNVSSYLFFGTCTENGRIVNVTLGPMSFTPTCSGGSWSVGPTNVSGVPDGPSISLTLTQTDLYGNSGNHSGTLVKNTSGHSVSIFLAPDIVKSNVTAYQVSGECSQNGQVVNVSIGGITNSPFCSGGSWKTFFLDVSSLANGAVTITASHASAIQASRTVWKDTSSPTVTISSAPNITAGNQSNYTVSGTCSEGGQSVSIMVDSLSFTRTCSNGAWSTGVVDVSSILDGTNILVTADHSTANQSSRTIVKSTLTPSASSLSVASTFTTSVNLNWNLVDPGGFTITDYVVEYRLFGQSTWLTATESVSTNTYATVTGLSPGTTYEFRVAVLYSPSQQSGWSNIADGETKPNSPVIGVNTAMNVGGAVDSTVVALEDGTNVTLNGSPLVSLNKGQTHRFTSVKFDVIDANKPIFTSGGRGTGNGNLGANIVWQPSAWAGKLFSFNSTRENFQQVEIFALEAATVEVYQGTTLLRSLTLAANGTGSMNWAPKGSYQLQSTGAILAFHISTDNSTRLVDPKPLLPNAFELIGFPSSYMNLSTGADGTNYTYTHSDSTVGSGKIDRSDVQRIDPRGTSSLYQSESLLIRADQKIFGASYADSNGSCAAPFLPTNLLKLRYAVPTNGDYIAFASKTPGTIQVLSPTNTVVTTLTLVRSGGNPDAPYRARYASPLAGQRYISTTPVAAWFQPNVSTGAIPLDETVLYGSN